MVSAMNGVEKYLKIKCFEALHHKNYDTKFKIIKENISIVLN